MTFGDRARRLMPDIALLAAGLAMLLTGLYFVRETVMPELRFRRSQAALAESMRTPDPGPPRSDSMQLDGWETEDRAYWRSLRMGEAFARLVIPDADVDAMVVKGAGDSQLEDAPGWITSTDLPGNTGNCAISGHRVTHGHPFRDLDRLVTGSVIELYSPYRLYRYAVVRTVRVAPDRVEIVGHTVRPRLTLTTCDPPGRATLRLVVQAGLIEVVRLRGPDGHAGREAAMLPSTRLAIRP